MHTRTWRQVSGRRIAVLESQAERDACTSATLPGREAARCVTLLAFDDEPAGANCCDMRSMVWRKPLREKTEMRALEEEGGGHAPSESKKD